MREGERKRERKLRKQRSARDRTDGRQREREGSDEKKKKERDEERKSGEVEKMIFNISNRLHLITRAARTGTCSSARGYSIVYP